MAILPNVVVSSTRGGSAVYTGRSVQIDTVPVRRQPRLPGADALEEMGPLNMATLYDYPDPSSAGGWLPNDQITVTAVTGFASLHEGQAYGVYSSAELGGRLPHVTATLIAIPAYPADWPTVLSSLDRYVENPSTKQSTPQQQATGVHVYLSDLSHEFILRGMAMEFRFRLVCDARVDIRNGDRLVGLPLVASNRPNRIATAQHVALHTLAGWPYKTAFVKVQE